MKYILILFFLTLIQNIFSQSAQEIEEKDVFQCDSIIKIDRYGNIDCKLIFKQDKFDSNNKNAIVIPHTKICIDDKSIIFSDEPRLAKTILKLNYDTCQVNKFKRKDRKRNYTELVSPIDSGIIKNWKLKVVDLENLCLDTKYHFVQVGKNDLNRIDFSCLHNIQIFELDLNKDLSTEIYLISYIWCASEIRIYRIDIKNNAS